MTTVPIVPAAKFLREAAVQLATTFQLPIIDTITTTWPFLLVLTEKRLELRDMTTTTGPIYVDFIGGTLGYRCRHAGGQRQFLAKAIGLKHGATPSVVDATAGLGRDSFMLAYLGCKVQMLERSSVVAALLNNGLQRAHAKIGHLVTERLQLTHADTQQWLSDLSTINRPEVIYLDPMYPHRQKSALVKKEMRIFRAVIGDDLDAPSLLNVALVTAKRRVVVKRPKLAPTLGELQPNFCIKSKNTRFDVYLC